MGIHAATEAEIAFDGVEIGPDDILIAGNPGDTEAFKVLLGHLNHERCGNASMCVGAAQGALEHAVRYMNEREVGGQPIAELQGLQWKLADMAMQLEGARLLLGRAVRLAGDGGTPRRSRPPWPRPPPTSPPSSCATRRSRSTAATGTASEYPVERAYRDIRGLCIGAGTIEAQRNYVGSNVAKGRGTGSPAGSTPSPVSPDPGSPCPNSKR